MRTQTFLPWDEKLWDTPNVAHDKNGRTYLREPVFGDPEEPHHRDALTLTFKTEQAVVDVLCRDSRINPAEATTLADHLGHRLHQHGCYDQRHQDCGAG